MVLASRADLLAYMLAMVGAEQIALSLEISTQEIAAWGDGSDMDDRSAGALLALARELFKPELGPDLQRIAKEHRARYMREYVRARRAAGLEDRGPADAEYRQRHREARRLKAAEYYARDRAGIGKRREERRRQAALAELFAIPMPTNEEETP